MNALALAGHNNPPSPFEESQTAINDLYEEAAQWLDGEAIDNQALADGVSKLLNDIRAAKKAADTARKDEAKPFDEGKKEVQERYNPLLKKADLATDTCKKALVPWLEKQEAEKRAQEAEARRIADEKKAEADAAIQASSVDNLEARAEAEVLIQDAKKADAAANRAAKDSAKASGGSGRAVSLRTSYETVLTDGFEAARHYWQTDRPAMEAWLTERAKKDVHAGKREIPGFTINEIKKAV